VKKLLIIAALERELAPLVKGWTASEVASQNRRVRIFETDAAIAACAGIGVINARIAAGAAYQHVKSEAGQFISAGLAGALIPEFQVGEIFMPAVIVDDVDNGRITAAAGSGTLVTASRVADSASKRSMATRHIARAVDMEAYAVADVARVYGIPFVAVKAISDTLDFPMPPLSRFISETGDFKTASFGIYVAMRPWLIPTVLELGRNSARATTSLSHHLEQMIQQHAAGLYNSKDRVSQVKN
jgi:adenosylhomocysteine nucleosidase